MPVEVMFVAIAGMGTFLLMIYIIGKAETEKARAKSASEADSSGLKQLVETNNAEIAKEYIHKHFCFIQI